jgi:DNA-binding transcriptional ArsR family regulator
VERSLTAPRILPTALGGSFETFEQMGHRLVSLPIADPVSVLCQPGPPSVPVGSLIGQSRTVILYALEDTLTIRDLARVTGQQRSNVVHHLEVLRQTNLVDVADAPSRGQARYRRSALAELLLNDGDHGMTLRRGPCS